LRYIKLGARKCFAVRFAMRSAKGKRLRRD
jgi:hypothetical protein